jgi:hypothetical protein
MPSRTSNRFRFPRIPLNDAFGTFGAATHISSGEITVDGVMLHGDVTMPARPTTFVDFSETSDGKSLTAFKSWVPGGNINQFADPLFLGHRRCTCRARARAVRRRASGAGSRFFNQKICAVTSGGTCSDPRFFRRACDPWMYHGKTVRAPGSVLLVVLRRYVDCMGLNPFLLGHRPCLR